MVDIDGSYEYSKIVRVQNKGNNQLRIRPNPVADVVTLSYLKPGLIELTDMQGNILQKIKKATGEMLKIDLKTYPTGIYLVKFFGTQEVIVEKIVKQ